MKVWVKIPDKPTVKSVVACLQSITKQLQQQDSYKSVTNIKLNGKDKSLEIVVDADESK